ncbi:uncharacterized protein LOC115453167 [Manduca sexta]|uniref:Uncharacterized protein n=1 Tax=Manduca sexta TaxID=7130 RepID=A0A921ZV34_MANSE|nr:uncharacterized protein LOC115453167 [Manduca sexta]KAG6464548.1 hypothetical protein O3G_MSEX014588 [Manduca sexta]
MLCRAALAALSPLALVLLFWCGPGGESKPFLAPLLLSGGLNNGTSLLELLALSHVQHKLDKLNALASLFGSFGNSTLSVLF